MRTATKKRLHFFVTALVVYVLGFQYLPETVDFSAGILLTDISQLMFISAAFAYFAFLPLLYWFWVIKAGELKPWRMLLVFSLSCVCARYSFPNNIAEYFEFISYVRYPIIAILLLIEFYLMAMVIKGLWQARKLSGDPRIHTQERFKDDEKRLAMALTFSWEPASWYYAIPRFSRRHVDAIANLNLYSAKRWHYALVMITCIAIGALSYYLIAMWSELVAIIVASIICYTVVFLTANYRVAKRYSVYINDDKLIINNSFLSFISIPLNQIDKVTLGEFKKSENKEQLLIGQGDTGNIELVFKESQTYQNCMASFPEQVDTLWLNLDSPALFEQTLRGVIVESQALEEDSGSEAAMSKAS